MDWTGGIEPARVDHANFRRVPLDDLEVRTLVQQRHVFRAAEELAAGLPPERAWRWRQWLRSLPEFTSTFGDC